MMDALVGLERFGGDDVDDFDVDLINTRVRCTRYLRVMTTKAKAKGK